MLATPDKLETVSADLFRSSMRRMAAQVGVIAARSGEVASAMTATAISSLSAEPPQILVCIHHQNRQSKLIREAGSFSVNMLSLQHISVARQCAMPNIEPAERFRMGNWTASARTGAPLLEEACVNFECRLQSDARHGTHFVFVGLVLGARFSAAPPLLYHDGHYSELGFRSDEPPLTWDSGILGF